jgi:hypothetical protein
MPRGHKENCQCPICVRSRNKGATQPAESPAITQPNIQKTPQAVPLNSLRVGDRFILRGEKYQAGIIAENMLQAISLDKPHLGRQMLDVNEKVFLTK